MYMHVVQPFKQNGLTKLKTHMYKMQEQGPNYAATYLSSSLINSLLTILRFSL